MRYQVTALGMEGSTHFYMNLERKDYCTYQVHSNWDLTSFTPVTEKLFHPLYTSKDKKDHPGSINSTVSTSYAYKQALFSSPTQPQQPPLKQKNVSFVIFLKHWKFAHGFNWWSKEYNERICKKARAYLKRTIHSSWHVEFGSGSTVLTLFWTTKGWREWNLRPRRVRHEAEVFRQPIPIITTNMLSIMSSKVHKE